MLFRVRLQHSFYDDHQLLKILQEKDTKLVELEILSNRLQREHELMINEYQHLQQDHQLLQEDISHLKEVIEVKHFEAITSCFDCL